jgi:acyl-CoA thioester hydrolase
MNKDFPLSGIFQDKIHIYPVRIYYENTDTAGVVYHAEYLKFAERARSEFLRLSGLEQSVLQQTHDCFFAAYHIHITYKGPARLDDLLIIETSLHSLQGARIKMKQVISKAGGHSPLVVLDIEIASITSSGKPKRLPKMITAQLAPYVL